MKTLKVTISNARAYAPMIKRETGVEYFPCFFDTSDPDTLRALDDMGKFRNPQGNFMLAASSKPIITVASGDYAELLDDLDILRARNLYPDAVFSDRPAELKVLQDTIDPKRFFLTEIILI